MLRERERVSSNSCLLLCCGLFILFREGHGASDDAIAKWSNYFKKAVAFSSDSSLILQVKMYLLSVRTLPE